MVPGFWQIALIVLLILLVFGAGRLPRIMGDMAKGIKSFKKGLNEEDDKGASTTGKQQIEGSQDDESDTASDKSDKSKS